MSTIKPTVDKKHEIAPQVKLQAKKIIGKNKAKLLLKQPFYGALLAMMDFIPEQNLPTMGTDGKKVYYNPEFVIELKEEEVCAVILHEVNHCIYMHCTTKRRGSRDRKRWNISCDFAINLEIKDMGYKLPENCLIDEKYRGLFAEQIYDRLPKDWKKMGTLDTHIENSNENDWDDMEEKIISAYEITKNTDQGTISEGIKRWISSIRNSKMPWQKVFHDYVGQTLSKDDYSFIRPNRRMMGQEIYVPSFRSYMIGRVVIAIDTSGSIDKECLKQFAGEIKEISHLIEEATIMTCDASVHEVVKILQFGNWIEKLKFEGGGGTAFEPVFDEVKRMINKGAMHTAPELLIYLTDAYGSYPEKHPPYPVLWCVTEEDGLNHIPWGKKVLIPK